MALPPAVDAAIERARACPRRPVVLADVWGNPGGGVPGDNTVLLKAMLDAGVDNAAFGTIWDPIAVRICHAAGAGAQLHRLSDRAEEPARPGVLGVGHQLVAGDGEHPAVERAICRRGPRHHRPRHRGRPAAGDRRDRRRADRVRATGRFCSPDYELVWQTRVIPCPGNAK